MDKQKKHYLYVGIVLACIGVVVSAAIVGVNALTKDKIAQNEKDSKEKAMRNVFPDCTFGETTNISNVEYLVSYTTASKSGTEQGDVYYTSGKNAYGAISMMIAIYVNGQLGNISLVENTQSFASPVEDNYVNPYNKNEITIDDVRCGATYGATLIKNMAKAAQNHYKGRKGL